MILKIIYHKEIHLIIQCYLIIENLNNSVSMIYNTKIK
jgi:hypothetical protein